MTDIKNWDEKEPTIQETIANLINHSEDGVTMKQIQSYVFQKYSILLTDDDIREYIKKNTNKERRGV